MAAKNLLVLGGLGVGGYLAYQWWQKNQAAAPSAAPTVTPAPAALPSPTQPAPSAPAYSGPSLDQIYAQLLAAAIAGRQGGDTAVSCPGMSGYRKGFGIGGQSTRATPVSTDPVPTGGRFVHPVAGGIPARNATGPAASPAVAPVSCSSPTATYDVWNWYLVNRTQAGISQGPSSTDAGIDPSVQLTGAQFWAAVAPLLRQQIPGISGLGFFASVFRGMGADATMPVDLSTLENLPSTSMAFNPQFTAEQIPGATINPVTGAVSVPLSAPSTPSWFSGVSNGAVVLGGGAAVLLLGVAFGGRR